MATPQPVGGDILINTPPDGLQNRPEFIALSNGSFLAVYSSTTDTGREIRGRVFNADGTADQAEFTISTTATGYHGAPSVTMLSDGRLVVSWQSMGVSGDPGHVLRARILNADGTAGADDFRIKANTWQAGQYFPSVTALANGGFAVSYEERHNYQQNIGITFYNSQGQVDSALGDRIVNDALSQFTSAPDIATLSNGSLIAVYTNDDRSTDGTGLDVRGRIIASNGTMGPEFTISTVTEGTQTEASMTSLSDDRFVVVWTDWNAADGPSSYRIKAQIFGNGGQPLGQEIELHASSAGEAHYPVVAALPDGGFAVAYEDSSSGDTDIRVATFDLSGASQGDTVVANDGTLGAQSFPSITVLNDGRIVVGWEDQPGDNWEDPVNIRARLFDLTGEVEGGAVINGTEGDDPELIGTAFADVINGFGGNDTINGGPGADQLNGGAGDDTYIITFPVAVINERAQEGWDRVIVHDSFSLAGIANVEELVAEGLAEARLTGNGLSNRLIGNAAANVIVAGAGNDTLNGGGGEDVLDGGVGDDTYYVDDGGVRIVEAAGRGSDTVHASVSYSLSADAEIETLIAESLGGIVLAGSATANAIFGNIGFDTIEGAGGDDVLYGRGGNDFLYGGAGDDVIDGGTGIDRMEGGTGNDVYYADETGDQVIEAPGGGSDTVYAGGDFNLGAGIEVEYLYATGSANVRLIGSSFANTIIGNAGANKIHGGLGKDVLRGGLGKDTFVFDTKPNKATNVDRVMDFNMRDDSFQLDNKYFTKLGSGTATKPKKVNADMFVINNKAKDREDRIVYDKKSGALYYDQDGTGSKAQIKIAILNKNLKLTHHDFFVI